MAKGFLEDNTGGYIPVNITVTENNGVVRIHMNNKGVSTTLVISRPELDSALKTDDGR